MPASDMPAAEVDITTGLVRALLRSQFPDLLDRPVTPLAFGWDNASYRLGDDLVVRLPRRQVAVPLLEAEQRWLPELAPRLPLPVPAAVGRGEPDRDYPWPWSIVPYLPGMSVLACIDAAGSLSDPVASAVELGAFHAALHRPAPPEAPPNPFRGMPLAGRDDLFAEHLARVAEGVDRRAVRAAWQAALDVPPWQGPPLWLHGDPHPGNLLTDGARITAVIDFGDMTGGDPATDVAAGWLVFPEPARATYRAATACDDATWHRARGWALAMGVAMLANSADNPSYARLGARTVAGVLADPV